MLQLFPLLLRLYFSPTNMKHLRLNLTVEKIEILPLLDWQLLAPFPRPMTCALTSGTAGVRCYTAHDISGENIDLIEYFVRFTQISKTL